MQEVVDQWWSLGGVDSGEIRLQAIFLRQKTPFTSSGPGRGVSVVWSGDHDASKKAKKADKPVTFNTAGGKRSVNKIVECWVREFVAIAKPYIMQNGCPNVLSMGRRCNHPGSAAGQSFVWIWMYTILDHA